MTKLKGGNEIVLAWKDIILDVADKGKEPVNFPTEKIHEKKAEKNQYFLFSFLNNVKLLINKAIGLQKSRLSRTWNSEGTKDLVGILVFVFGYGVLGYAALLTFSDRWVLGYETGLHVFGVGSAIYLFMDLWKYTIDTIRGRRK